MFNENINELEESSDSDSDEYIFQVEETKRDKLERRAACLDKTAAVTAVAAFAAASGGGAATAFIGCNIYSTGITLSSCALGFFASGMNYLSNKTEEAAKSEPVELPRVKWMKK